MEVTEEEIENWTDHEWLCYLLGVEEEVVSE